MELQPIIDLMMSESETCQERAAEAIRSICLCNKEARGQLAQLGGLKPLVSMLTSESSVCQHHAAAAIANICRSNDSARGKVMSQLVLCALIGLLGTFHKRLPD